MNAEQWLEQFSKKIGVDAPTEQERELLLKIAANAAHDSERLAAPLACWMVGKAGISPEAAASIAATVTDPTLSKP